MEVDMDDNYIDNLFREKFETPQQHDFDESAWLNLESRLESGRETRIIPWRWLAVAGILLPMLLVSSYFYYELRQTEAKLTKLELKLNHLLTKKQRHADSKINNNSSEPNNHNIEHALEIRQSVSHPKSFKAAKSTTSNISVTAAQASNKYTTPPIISNTNIVKEEIAPEINTIDVEESTSSSKATIAKAMINQTNIDFIDGKQRVVTNDSKRKELPITYRSTLSEGEQTLNNKAQLQEVLMTYFLPIGFEISAGTFSGIQIPNSKHLATIQNAKPFLSSRGIEVAANFVNGVDLTVGANLASYSYETTTIEQDFPNVEPNSIGDIFNNVTVTEDIVQIPVGLRYNIGEYDNTIMPFVEVGGIAKRSIETSHRFEYLPSARGNKPYAISPKPQREKENFAMNTAFVSGGLKWNPKTRNQILNNVVVQAEVFVNADFETTETAWAAGVGLSANYLF